MNAVTTQNENADIAGRLLFLKNLQAVTNKIHATANIDEIMLEVSQDICELFNADRLTIYSISEDKGSIVSKVKTGLTSFKDIRLPLSDISVAGYVGANRKLVNIQDVYDDAELKRYSPRMQFLKEVDKRTGYRSKQMLVAPIIDLHSDALMGVMQMINHRVDKPFSQAQVDGALELAKTMAIAFANRQRPAAVRTKYDGLISDGVISVAEIEEAQRSARKKELDLEEVLITEFNVSPAAIGQALHRFFDVKYEPFKSDRMKPGDLLKNLKRDYLEEQQWLPLEETEEGVVICAIDPEATKSSRVVSNIFPKGKIAWRVTTQREFQKTLDSLYGAITEMGSVDDLLSGLGDDEVSEGVSSDDVSAAADNELVKLVNKVIVEAYQQGVSDIHIEPRPGKEKTLIRFRKDGSLIKYIEVPASFRNALIARIKIMCDLDISEKRKPQDGKIKFKKYGPVDIELRVATIPSAGGVEDVVMRILAAGEPIPLNSLGLSVRNLENLKKCVAKPYGLFFVCGPTGSGKTTTLHSVLGHLNTPDTKIWTAEDPVEITQKGLRQVQVNKKAGLDFATVMKAFLRADPDIIMVGEMRDAETTGIGIEASLTGHLVFATLHTNSAPESIIRLLDMGMDPFNFGDALLGILAQRLGKRLCKECKQPYQPDAQEIDHLLDEYCEELRNTDAWKADPVAGKEAIRQEWLSGFAKDGKFTLYSPKGCSVCGDTGYKGRVGLHEMLVATDEVKRLIQEKARVAQLLAEALNSAGMRTLKMDGVEKVLQGITDMKQVRAVCIK